MSLAGPKRLPLGLGYLIWGGIVKSFIIAVALVLAGILGVGACSRPRTSTASEHTRSRVPAAAVPVLLYHGITRSGGSDISQASDGGGVSLAAFKVQLAYLHDRGYRTISPAQYVGWVEGKHLALPPKPVLITFDDGQASAVRAQPVLRRYGFDAVMYVVSGFADGAYGRFYLRWSGLAALARDGWYMQFHAGPCGHGYISPDTPYHCAAGLAPATQGAKIGHRFYPQPFGQAPGVYHARVKADVVTGLNAMRSAFGYPANWHSVTFAVPWDDWGQPATSDQPWLARYFAQQFPVVFVQGSYPGNHFAWAHHMRYRFQVDNLTTFTQFRVALRDSRFMKP